jgi:phage/plasmid primase-like uncharacterized protein
MKQSKTNISILAFLALGIITFSSCKDDEVVNPPNPNEEELITTVELVFTNAADSSDVSTFKFADPDGEGGNAPTQQDTIRLAQASNYTLAVRFLDESSSDVEDITEEVKEEAEEHLICYTTDASTTVIISDKDVNGLNIGLSADVETSVAVNGTFTIALKHQPDVKDGSCDLGETDVEVAFALEVE